MVQMEFTPAQVKALANLSDSEERVLKAIARKAATTLADAKPAKAAKSAKAEKVAKSAKIEVATKQPRKSRKAKAEVEAPVATKPARARKKAGVVVTAEAKPAKVKKAKPEKAKAEKVVKSSRVDHGTKPEAPARVLLNGEAKVAKEVEPVRYHRNKGCWFVRCQISKKPALAFFDGKTWTARLRRVKD